MAAQNFIFSKIAKTLCKAEVTHGEDALPVVASDSIYVKALSIKPAQSAVEIQALRAAAAAAGQAVVALEYEVEMEVYLAGPIDDSGLKADITKWAGAAGFLVTETGAPVTVITLTPNSLEHDSCTIYNYLYGDGQANCQLQKLKGCVFAPILEIPAKEPPFFKLSGKGLYTLDTNPAKPAAAVYLHPEDCAPAYGWTITADGRNDAVSKMTIDFGWEVVSRESLGTGAYGFAGHVLRRKGSPTIQINQEAVYTSTKDYVSAALARTGFAFSAEIDTLGGGNWMIEADNAHWLVPPIEDGDGVKMAPNTIVCMDSTDDGDDSISITLTAP